MIGGHKLIGRDSGGFALWGFEAARSGINTSPSAKPMSAAALKNLQIPFPRILAPFFSQPQHCRRISTLRRSVANFHFVAREMLL